MYNPQSNPNTLQPQDTEPQGKRQTGSGFTNINKLVGANVGAGTQMGQQIGQGIGSQAGNIVKSADASTNKFLGDYAASKGSALNTIGNIGGLAGQVGAGGTVASGSALGGLSEGEAAQKGREFADVKYAGPTALAGSQQLSGQATGLGETGKAALGGTLGQKSLLQSMVARPGQYTRGQSTLDTALMGQSSQAQQALQQGAQQAFQAQKNVGAQQSTAQNLAQQAGATISQQKSDIGSLMNKNLQDVQTAATTQADLYNKEGTRLKQLMGGYNPETGTLINKDNPYTYTDADVALLDKMDQFGITPDASVYGRNSDEYNNVLTNLVKGIDTSQTSRYLNDQQSAAKNLALMTQQNDLSKSIGENKFNEKLFSPITQQETIAENAKLASDNKATIQERLPAIQDTLKMVNDAQNRLNANKGNDGPSGGIKDHLIAALPPAERNYALGLHTAGQVYDYIRAYHTQQMNNLISSNTGQQKTIKQLALERMGKTYTPDIIKDPTSKKLTQVD